MAKILYIEDSWDIAELVGRWLAGEGHEFVHAAEAEEGLALAADEGPDLVLLDIKLGEFSIDGFEVNRRLKANPATRSLRVVGLSAHAQDDDHIARARSEGFAGQIGKPFTYDQLMGQVAAHLEAKGDQ